MGAESNFSRAVPCQWMSTPGTPNRPIPGRQGLFWWVTVAWKLTVYQLSLELHHSLSHSYPASTLPLLPPSESDQHNSLTAPPVTSGFFPTFSHVHLPKKFLASLTFILMPASQKTCTNKACYFHLSKIKCIWDLHNWPDFRTET